MYLCLMIILYLKNAILVIKANERRNIMFILYPEQEMKTILPDRSILLYKDNEVNLVIDNQPLTYTAKSITKDKIELVLSYKDLNKTKAENMVLIFKSDQFNMLSNMLYNTGVVSVVVDNTFVLYSTENQKYYNIGSELMVRSRKLNMYDRKIRFSGVEMSSDNITVILEDDKCVYKMKTYEYNGNTPFDVLNTGVPFYSDIHCIAEKSFF